MEINKGETMSSIEQKIGNSRTLSKVAASQGKFQYKITKVIDPALLNSKEEMKKLNTDWKYISMDGKYFEIMKRDVDNGIVERVELLYKSKLTQKEWSYELWSEGAEFDIFENVGKGKTSSMVRVKVKSLEKKELQDQFKKNVALEVEANQKSMLANFGKVLEVSPDSIGRGDMKMILPFVDIEGEDSSNEYLVSLKKNKTGVRVANLGVTDRSFGRFLTSGSSYAFSDAMRGLLEDSKNGEGDFESFESVDSDVAKVVIDTFNGMSAEDRENFIFRLLNLSEESETYEFYGKGDEIIVGYQKYKSVEQIKKEQASSFLSIEDIEISDSFRTTKTSIVFTVSLKVNGEAKKVNFKVREKSGGKRNQFGIETTVSDVSSLSKMVILDKKEGNVESLIAHIKSENPPARKMV